MGILGLRSLKTKFILLNYLLPPELHHLNLIGYDMGEEFTSERGLEKGVQEAGGHEGG
jgi:hypothetical protein